MSAKTHAVTMKVSRLRLLPQAIVLSTFLLPVAFLATICGYTLMGKDHTEMTGLAAFAILTAMSLLFVWFQVRTLRRLVHPDLLSVTVGGVEPLGARGATILGQRWRNPFCGV